MKKLSRLLWIFLMVSLSFGNTYSQKDKWFHLIGEIFLTGSTVIQFNGIHKYSVTREFYVKSENALQQLNWTDIKNLKYRIRVSYTVHPKRYF